MQEDILEKFVEESDVVAPENLVEEAYDRLILEITHKRKYEAMMTGQFYMPGTMEFSEEYIRQEALKQVKTGLALEEVIQKQKLEATKEELETEAKAMADRQQTTVEAIKGFFGEDLSILKQDILIRKAIDFITS
jgi:trigger factor